MTVTKTFKANSNEDNNEQKRVFLCWREAVDSFTPPEKLAEFAKDKSPRVRSTVAHNFSTSVETLMELSKDEDESVAKAALKNIELRSGKPPAPDISGP